MEYFGSFGQSKQEALKLLEPVLDSALEAHQTGSYADYMKLVTDELSAKVTEQGFIKAYREIRPSLGDLIEKSFLASLNRNDNPMLLYSAKYTGTSDDVLINITFKNNTMPPKIEWLWIE